MDLTFIKVKLYQIVAESHLIKKRLQIYTFRRSTEAYLSNMCQYQIINIWLNFRKSIAIVNSYFANYFHCMLCSFFFCFFFNRQDGLFCKTFVSFFLPLIVPLLGAACAHATRPRICKIQNIFSEIKMSASQAWKIKIE